MKNKYCHIQGLSFELRKKPGSYDGTALQAGSYEAVWTQTGSIDDAFPNFIATNEHVSIAKASNEIREFIIDAKAGWQQGEMWRSLQWESIPISDGVQVFELNTLFQLSASQSIAANIITVKPQESDASVTSSFSHYNNDNENGGKSKINWGLIILWSAVLIGVITGVVFAVRYFVNQPGKDNPAVIVQTQDTIMLISLL